MMDALRPIPLAGTPSGPPLLLIHGFMGNADDWRPVADRLCERHYVLGVNLPGHGAGWDGEPIETYDMAACASALNEHLDSMALGPCTLLGYSMGGRFALYLAVHFPERYIRIVLESASPGLDTQEKRDSRRDFDALLADQLSTIGSNKDGYRIFLEEWYALPLFESLSLQPEKRERLIESRVAGNDPSILAKSLVSLGTGAQPDLWPALTSYGTPTLLIVGELDRKFRMIAEDMSAICPAMAMEVFAQCGHVVHLEKTDAFVVAVRGFLGSSGARQ
jgi:2-succinyl-6-hydroxy-2,4-cyclohexadiene-1-carboxylate synthase